jgi:hypothetical protein
VKTKNQTLLQDGTKNAFNFRVWLKFVENEHLSYEFLQDIYTWLTTDLREMVHNDVSIIGLKKSAESCETLHQFRSHTYSELISPDRDESQVRLVISRSPLMPGNIFARILIVIILIATAHAVRPFTVKNITSHLLYFSRSLAFILPESMRTGFDRANQLALTLSNSLFSEKEYAWSKETTATADKPVIFADITADEAEEAAAEMARVSQKQRLIAKRRVRIDLEKDKGAEGEPAVAPLPVLPTIPLPVFRVSVECILLKRFQTAQQNLRIIYKLKKSGCDKTREEKINKQFRMIALIEESGKKKKAENFIFNFRDCEREAEKVPDEYDYSSVLQDRESDVTDEIDRPEMNLLTDNCVIP